MISNAVRGYLHWAYRQRSVGSGGSEVALRLTTAALSMLTVGTFQDEKQAELQRDIGQWCTGLLGRDFEVRPSYLLLEEHR